VLLDDFFEDVPNLRALLLTSFFALLDGGDQAAFFQLVVDERLEQPRAPIFLASRTDAASTRGRRR